MTVDPGLAEPVRRLLTDDDAALSNACNAIAEPADYRDERLQRRFGGQLAYTEVPPQG